MDIKQLAGQSSAHLKNDKTRDTSSSQGSPAKLNANNEQASESRTDTLSISSQSEKLQVAIASLDNVPDIRQERVEQLRNSINSGDYQVNAQNTADKLIQFDLDLF